MVLGRDHISIILQELFPSKIFSGINVSLCSFLELIQVYRQTVGRNHMLMLDRTGLIPSDYVRCYEELGDVIRSCYDNSILPTHHLISDDSLEYIQLIASLPVSVDRSIVQEDQTHGQMIQNCTIDV